MTASVIATTVTTPTTRHLSIFAADTDLTPYAFWPSLSLVEQASKADPSGRRGDFGVTVNRTLAQLPELREQAPVLVIDHDAADGQQHLFRGFVKGHKPLSVPGSAAGGFTTVSITATDHGEALNNIIPYEFRPIESAAARIGYLWGRYANHWLSPDLTHVTINVASLPAQKFRRVTLYRALDMVAAQADPSAAWYLHQDSRLHFFTTETNAAPDNIDTDAPGAGEIAPHDLEIEYDSAPYVNTVWVEGATEDGSGYVYNHEAIAKAGGSIFSTLIQAPDCTTATMRDAIGNMYLGRVYTAAMRGSFSASSPDDGWRAGQTLTITSAAQSLSAQSTRTVRVAMRLLSSDTTQRRYDVEFGRIRRRYVGTRGTLPAPRRGGPPTQPTVGGGGRGGRR